MSSDFSPSLLEDSFYRESSKLGVVRATFGGYEQGSFEGLISGYSSMKVLTYSNSVSIVNRAAGALEKLEIIFGREDLVGGMARYLHYQELLIEELIREIKGKDHIKRKISEGNVKLFVVKDEISHEKLFLLEGDQGTRVITGSANFSEKAFSGKQNESYICFDDDAGAWEHFNHKYEKIKANSTLSITEKALLADGFDAEDLPALSPGQKDGSAPIIVVPDKPSDASILHKVLSKTPNRYAGLNTVIPSTKGVAKIDKPTASRALRYVKSNSRSEGENPEEYLDVYLETGRVLLSGKELELEAPKQTVESDVASLLEYFRGYDRFRGDTEKLTRDYFTFMSWFYMGPFICDLRNTASAKDDYVFDYPIFGILYGKSNCGKSELIQTLLVSMFSKEGFLPNEWFTRTGVAALREQNRRYPLIFDDLDRTRFNNHATALIKEDSIGAREYPAVVLSMNADKDTFEPELRKRCLIVYTGASLPDHTGESRELARSVKRIKRNLTNALYREYLKRVLARLREETPADILEFSSGILHEIFAEHSPEPLPAWCRITNMNEYTRSKHDKVKDELIQIRRHNPDAWSEEGDKTILKLGDVLSSRKLLKDIPDYVIGSGSRGDAIIFDTKELEGFLGMPLSRRGGPFKSLARAFKRRRS